MAAASVMVRYEMKCGVETVQISLLPTSAKMVDVRRHFEPVRFVWQRRWRRSVLLALSIARVSLVYVKPECLKDLFGALNHFSWGRLHSAPVETILGQTHHHPPPYPLRAVRHRRLTLTTTTFLGGVISSFAFLDRADDVFLSLFVFAK